MLLVLERKKSYGRCMSDISCHPQIITVSLVHYESPVLIEKNNDVNSRLLSSGVVFIFGNLNAGFPLKASRV